MKLREKIWLWFVYKILKIDQGEEYPLYLRILNFMFFPWLVMQSVFCKNNIYDPYFNAYIIEGEEYSRLFFLNLKNADNKILKIKKSNGLTTITEYKREPLDQAISIIKDLIDDEPCRFDHHGYCQSHGWMATWPPCPQKRAKEFLEEFNNKDS